MFSRKTLVPFSAAALLMVSFCAQADDDDPRQITVNGRATVTTQPDIARISMTVVERNESLGAASEAIAATTGRVLDLLDRLNIDRKHIDTTGVMIRPNYRWNRTAEEQELLGYIIERQINVELHELEKLGVVIERSVEAGVNQMTPPNFDHTKRTELHREALASAVRDARANADVMAEAAGAKVGTVLQISGGASMPQPRPLMRAMAADSMAESAAETYVAGDIRFEANVNIVYEIAP